MKDLNEIIKKLPLDEDEKELFSLWKDILAESIKSPNYNPEFNYGVYQITKEINTFKEDEKGCKVPNNPELNGYLIALRTKLKAYYKSHITAKMFEYELLK